MTEEVNEEKPFPFPWEQEEYSIVIDETGKMKKLVYDEFSLAELEPIMDEVRLLLENRLKKKGFPKDLKFYACVLVNHFDESTRLAETTNMQAHEKILALSSAIHSEASDEMSSKAGPPFENMREYAQKDNEGRVFMKKRERW